MLTVIKNILYFLALALTVSCVPDDLLVQVSKDKMRAEAIKNGRHWNVPEAIFILRGNNQDTLLIQMSSQDRDEPIKEAKAQSIERVSFTNIPFRPGTYGLSTSPLDEKTTKSSVTYSILENDIVKYSYRLESQEDEYFLSIDKISQDDREISGTFNATFVLEDIYLETAPEAILRQIEFTSGFFISEQGI